MHSEVFPAGSDFNGRGSLEMSVDNGISLLWPDRRLANQSFVLFCLLFCLSKLVGR